MPFDLEKLLVVLSFGSDNIFSTRLLIICCRDEMIVRFIEKSTGSSTLIGYAVVEAADDDEEDDRDRIGGLAPKVEVKFGVVLLEHLNVFVPDELLFESSEKALSITLSRVSWSREMYGTISVPFRLISCLFGL